MMISGHVQAWVKDHCNGQKTDLNDAFAILNLAYDRWLTPIRGKTREECRLLALQSSYRQLKGLFRLFGETGSSMVPWSRSELAREKDAAKFPS